MSGQQVVIVGAGFAGYHCARELVRRDRQIVDVTLINPTDYFLYLPLLPQVTGGLLSPQRVAVSLLATLPRVRLVLGHAGGVDVDARRVRFVDVDGRPGEVGYDRLVLAAGSVNKLLPIPGITDYAHGYRDIAEALYLHDHLVRQVELADTTDDPAERAARLTFVVVGAGYTGTEVAAHGQLLTRELLRRHPRLADTPCRWLLLDTADRVLPGLDPRMSRTADRVLRRRGVDVRLGTSLTQATADGVHLSDGDVVATHTLAWCVGVRPDPFAASIGLSTDRGRLVVDEYLNIPDHSDIYACGDAAAVPDPGRPGQITAMTAQHAQRQGQLAARNIAASYGIGRRRPYRHHDLGFAVDLGGADAAVNPFQIPVSGPLGAAMTIGYHLLALPSNRLHVAADWTLDLTTGRQTAQLGLVTPDSVRLDSSEPAPAGHAA
jgi:NADH:ubiquinone reductase (H+-translocating)